MSVLKLKITGKKLKVLEGCEILDLNKGSLVRIIKEPNGENCLGDILIKTDEYDYPYMVIHSKDKDFIGTLWSEMYIESRHFEVIEATIEIE